MANELFKMAFIFSIWHFLSLEFTEIGQLAKESFSKGSNWMEEVSIHSVPKLQCKTCYSLNLT